MIDKETLRKWWDIFVGDGNFTEIRILGRFQYSGYFKSFDNLAEAIEPYSNMDDEQIYFVLNKIDGSCYGRQQCEKIVKSPKITTNDPDIVHRYWVLCDFDPIRKSGTNSTNEQLEFAHKKAQDVYRFLRDRGFSDPVICKSGNGWHNLYRVDIPVSEEATEIIKGFFKFMGDKFTDDNVDFDEKNFNNSRLCKCYGTMAKKGANLPDMPWRMSEIVYVPKEIIPTPLEKFKELADEAPKEEPKVAPNRKPNFSSNTPFDLREWLNRFGVVYKESQEGGGTKFALEHCPWEDTHSNRQKWDSALFLAPNGQVTFNCFHSHCKNRTWFDFRQFYEPDAYNKPAFTPQVQQRQFVPQVPQKPKYEIKTETPELGKKWLSLSDIEKIDVSAIPRVKTGILALDRLILGLAECEVTLLSGSNSSGKSSWLNTLVLNFIEQGWPCALFSGELPPQILKTWIQMVAAGKENLRPSTFNDGKYYVPNEVSARIDAWTQGKLFLFNNEYGNTWEEVLYDMKELANVGVKVFILDNLMSLDIDLLEGDRNNKQKMAILQIKKFSKETNSHVILVAHPRKSTAFLRKNDISGTSDLTNAVDNVFIFHRVNQDFLKAGAEFYGQSTIQSYQSFGNVVEVSKNRMFGVCDVLIGMYYEIESRRFKNYEYEAIRYGWENERPIENAPQYIQSSFEYNTNDHAPIPEMPFGETREGAPF